MESSKQKYPSISPRDLELILRLKLPQLQRDLKKLEEAKKVPREILELEFTI